MMNSKNIQLIIKIILGVLITGGGLFIFYKSVDIDTLIDYLLSANLYYIGVAGLLGIATLYFRAFRWAAILPNSEGSTKEYLFSYTMIGYMINNLLPARIGEAVRAGLLWKKNGHHLMTALGSLIAERIIDATMFSLFLVVSVLTIPQCRDNSELLILTTIAGCGAFTIITVAILYGLFKDFTIKIGHSIIRKLPQKTQFVVKKIAHDLMSALGWLHSTRKTMVVIGYSMIVNICYPLIFMCIAYSIDGSLSFAESLFLQFFAAFGAAVPLSPGYVGTQHAVLQYAFELLGKEGSWSGAVTVLYHAVNYIFVTVLGCIFFFRLKLSLDDLKNRPHKKNT